MVHCFIVCLFTFGYYQMCHFQSIRPYLSKFQSPYRMYFLQLFSSVLSVRFNLHFICLYQALYIGVYLNFNLEERKLANLSEVCFFFLKHVQRNMPRRLHNNQNDRKNAHNCISSCFQRRFSCELSPYIYPRTTKANQLSFKFVGNDKK